MPPNALSSNAAALPLLDVIIALIAAPARSNLMVHWIFVFIECPAGPTIKTVKPEQDLRFQILEAESEIQNGLGGVGQKPAPPPIYNITVSVVCIT